MVRLTRGTFGFTIATAVAAILASLFAGLQWRENVAAGRQIDQQIAIARQQTDNVRLQALASSSAAESLQRQIDVTRQQVVAAKDQAASARVQTMVGARSAESLARQVQLAQDQLSLVRAQSDLAVARTLQEARSLRLTITRIGKTELGARPSAIVQVSNDGNLPIRIIAIASSFAVSMNNVEETTNKMFASIVDNPESKTDLILNGGQHFNHTNSPNIPFEQDFIDSLDSGMTQLVFVTHVVYEDAYKRLHRSYACGYRDSTSEDALHLCLTPTDN